MKIYDENKENEIKTPDLSKGRLNKDKLHIHKDEIPFVKEQGHYETIKEYDNGGKDVNWVVDKQGTPYQQAQDYDEEIYIYVPYTDEELGNREIENLRIRRQLDCFAICDRACWYDSLTDEQKQDIQSWRKEWLAVTTTKVIPNKPKWL